jgi:hypothetical protein
VAPGTAGDPDLPDHPNPGGLEVADHPRAGLEVADHLRPSV